MPAPRMISTTGSALTADEMSFAWRIFASFSVDMKRGWVKVIRRQDPTTGTIVEYHADKDIAYVTPGGAVDYVMMAMPNPVPYRGISAGVVNRGVPTKKVTMVRQISTDPATNGGLNISTDWVIDIKNSLGTTLASLTAHSDYYPIGYGEKIIWTNFMPEMSNGNAAYDPSGMPSAPLWEMWTGTVFYLSGVRSGAWEAIYPTYESLLAADIAAGVGGTWTYVMSSDGAVLASEVQSTSSGHTYYVPDTSWNGEGYVNMYVDSVTPANLNHQLSFAIPEDGIYPIPTTPPAVFNTRRKAWFKKNSDEFIAALKTGFATNAPGVARAELKTGALPASWDYLIKRDVDVAYSTYSADVTVGQHTKMPIIMSITSAADVVVSDTSANLTIAGTKVTRRTTTFAYTDAAGVAWSVVVDGTLTQIVTVHTLNGADVNISRKDTYLKWYSPDGVQGEPFVLNQFVLDTSAYGVGLLWSGYTQLGYNETSVETSYPMSALPYVGYVPPYPAYSNTLVGTAPDIFLQYHNTVKPVYVSDAAQASTVMNNSAMYGVTKVELTPVGLIANGVGTAAAGESVGIFSSIEDGVQIEIYGTAVYNFDWQIGALTFVNWKPLHGTNGLEVASKTVDLPQGILWSDVGINCVVTYRGIHWPDIIRAISVRNRGLPTAVNPEDRVLGALMDAVKAG